METLMVVIQLLFYVSVISINLKNLFAESKKK